MEKLLPHQVITHRPLAEVIKAYLSPWKGYLSAASSIGEPPLPTRVLSGKRTDKVSRWPILFLLLLLIWIRNTVMGIHVFHYKDASKKPPPPLCPVPQALPQPLCTPPCIKESWFQTSGLFFRRFYACKSECKYIFPSST